VADLDGRSRGQIILVAAFALAVIFITLALIVNSAIFTQNLASRGETSGADDALSHRAMVEESVGENVEIANRRNNSVCPCTTDLRDAIQYSIENTSVQGERQQVTSGGLIAVSYGSNTLGDRIYQEDPAQLTFDDAASSSRYAVAEDVTHVPGVPGANGTRAFRINASSISGTFGVEAVNADPNSNETWEMSVSKPTANTVRIDTLRNDTSPNIAESCEVTVDSAPYRIDVTDGTINGKPCDALGTNDAGQKFTFGTGATDGYDIYFDNAGSVQGNFSMVVHGASGFGSHTLSRDTALYDVTVDYTYETSGLYYDTTIRVAPGEPDA